LQSAQYQPGGRRGKQAAELFVGDSEDHGISSC
jgi:hypothetical protein